jgi:hypothetical protein
MLLVLPSSLLPQGGRREEGRGELTQVSYDTRERVAFSYTKRVKTLAHPCSSLYGCIDKALLTL